MNITTVGADLAKEVITVCAQDRSGRSMEKRDVRRAAFRGWLQRLPAGCVVGMEACSSSHYWAREMRSLGLEPRIMAAEFVQPFRKSRAGNNDRNDAEAIAVATVAVDGKSLMALLERPIFVCVTLVQSNFSGRKKCELRLGGRWPSENPLRSTHQLGRHPNCRRTGEVYTRQ